METQILQVTGQIFLLITVCLLFYVCYRYLTVTTITKENPYDPNRKDSFNRNQINKYENSSVVERKDTSNLNNPNYNPLGIPDLVTPNGFESTPPLLQLNSINNDPLNSNNDPKSMTMSEVLSKLKDITNNESLITNLEKDTSNSKVEFLGNLDKDLEEEIKEEKTIEKTSNKQEIPAEPLRRRRKREWRDD